VKLLAEKQRNRQTLGTVLHDLLDGGNFFVITANNTYNWD